jgi:hypothetical protein
MTLRYAVGLEIGNKADQVAVEAEDALICCAQGQDSHPEAATPTCASETSAAIDAIRIRAKSARTRPGHRRTYSAFKVF